jgi:hypothetical protein
MTDFDAVANEREELSAILKILESRKKKLTEVIKSFLESSGQGAEMGDVYYRLSRRPRDIYPAADAVRIIADKTGDPEEVVLKAVGSVSNKAIDTYLKEFARRTNVAEAGMIRAALANISEKTYTTSLYHRKKGSKTKADKAK